MHGFSFRCLATMNREAAFYHLSGPAPLHGKEPHACPDSGSGAEPRVRIKVELRHTDKSVAQISDEMGFPNPSFFSKYFKRLTGMTPAAFKNS